MCRVCSYASDPGRSWFASTALQQRAQFKLATFVFAKVWRSALRSLLLPSPRMPSQPHVLLRPTESCAPKQGRGTPRLGVTDPRGGTTLYSVLQARLKLLMKGGGKSHHQSWKAAWDRRISCCSSAHMWPSPRFFPLLLCRIRVQDKLLAKKASVLCRLQANTARGGPLAGDSAGAGSVRCWL